MRLQCGCNDVPMEALCTLGHMTRDSAGAAKSQASTRSPAGHFEPLSPLNFLTFAFWLHGFSQWLVFCEALQTGHHDLC